MRLALFATNQYLLLTAINLKYTLYSRDEVHLYTTISFRNTLFDDVFFLRDDGVIEETSQNLDLQMKMAYYGDDDFLEKSKEWISFLDKRPASFDYDAVVAMGYTYFPFWIVAHNRKYGKNTRLIRLCDGVVFKYSPINYHFNEAFSPLLHISGILSGGFDEELLYDIPVDKKSVATLIPQISPQDQKQLNMIDQISGYSNRYHSLEHFQYFIFTSATISGRNFFSNETEIIQKILKNIDNNKAVILPHPRRDISDLKFLKVKINDFKWSAEFLYPHLNIENKTFISAATNAVYTPVEIFGRVPRKVFFLDHMLHTDEIFLKRTKFDEHTYFTLHQKMFDEYKNRFYGHIEEKIKAGG